MAFRRPLYWGDVPSPSEHLGDRQAPKRQTLAALYAKIGQEASELIFLAQSRTKGRPRSRFVFVGVLRDSVGRRRVT